LHLFGLNPSDLGCMETILQLAAKARSDAVAQWIAPVLADAYNNAKKLSASRYQTACEAMDAAAEVAVKHGNHDGAMETLRAAVAIAEIWVRHNTESSTAQKARADATGNLAIVRGKFDRSDDFTDSLKDADGQHDLQDRDKRTHTVDRMQQLIDRARADWEANPGVANKLLSLVDLMVRAETDEMESEAVKLLKREHASSENYVFKQKADDVAIRQLARVRRAIVAKLKADPQRPDLRKQLKLQDRKINEFETRVYEERSKQYPTDMRVKYELARRLFHGGRIDEAIPLFQHAAADARVRGDCRLHLGKCFYAKKFFAQAIDVLRQALKDLGAGGGELPRELNYWLARALEASGDADEARKTYGHLIQLDYNYRDARLRLERLVSGGEK
jgi:tetratricopeptide (TPR) repeat protein